MLSRLKIKNIALIDELEISLGAGLGVLSGETGAGKSIIVDSVNLALGERADRELIRSGQDRAVVEAWFEDVPKEVLQILADQEIETDGSTVVLSRELSASGKNVCRINGSLVTLAVLKQTSDLLVDIHGQHEHQSLLNEKNHIGMLDSFGEGIEQAKQKTQQLYREFRAVKKRLLSISGNEGDRERRIDMLRFQIDEIQKAAVRAGEEEELKQRKTLLNAAERIAEALSGAYGYLYDDDANALAMLKDAGLKLQGIEDVDNKFAELSTKADEAYYIVEEIASSISAEISENYFDAGELEDIEQRLSLISSLSRKYGDAAVDGGYIKKAEQELEDLIGSEELIAELSAELEKKKDLLYGQSCALSELRRKAADEFSDKMQQQLCELGMTGAVFKVNMLDILPKEECAFTANGIDSVEFYISANRGEPAKPLRRVASGGEVSRIMLALKNIAANEGGIPTMIFDEIDTGISGRMAEVVARKLRNIAQRRQVICVTHLPQIASMADKHFRISKSSNERSTTTDVEELTENGRVGEIARLAGGESSVSFMHAREMIQKAQEYKSSV